MKSARKTEAEPPFLNCELQCETFSPVFDGDPVVVVLSANDFYAPYISCVLQSILESAMDPERCYDIIVLSNGITEENQRIMQEQLSEDRFSLRFYDVAPIMKFCEKLHVRGHFSVETYFRLLIPEILPDYKKALYLDSDLVVLRDVADLYDVDVSGYLLAATHDADTAGMYNGYDPTLKDYFKRTNLIENPYDYFQAGVVLLNLEEFRKSYTTLEMLQVAASRNWYLLDQDVLNHLAQGRVLFVDMAWNTMMDWEGLRVKSVVSLAPDELRDAYHRAREVPYIVHYAGPGNKPWEYRNADMGEYFWYYARKSPYYEEISSRLDKLSHSVKGQLKLIGQYWEYRIGMRIADFVFPPKTLRRKFMYKFYLMFGEVD